jgi:hypothetical protein
MNTFFKALPADLQWEILVDFVGTHAVRNGKLMRKLVIPFQHPPLKYRIFHIDPKFPWRYGKYGTTCVHPEIPAFLSENVDIVSYVMLSDGSRIMCGEGTITKQLSYIFRTETKIVEGRQIWDHERFVVDDSVILDPFVKHSYPSYPFTNKKNNIFLSRLAIK